MLLFTNKKLKAVYTFQYYIKKLFRSKTYRKRLELIATDNEYSLKAILKTGIIFVHIPKCAGTTIAYSLYGNKGLGHSTLTGYQKYLSPDELQRMLIFTVVRNPWDRIVSAYCFLKSGGMNDKDAEFAKQHLSIYDSFDSFVKCWVSKENIKKSLHFQPQLNFILDQKGLLQVDEILRLENLNDDFNSFCTKYQISAKLGNLNKSRREHYQNYYSEKSKKIVGEVYKKDIEYLGYSY